MRVRPSRENGSSVLKSGKDSVRLWLRGWQIGNPSTVVGMLAASEATNGRYRMISVVWIPHALIAFGLYSPGAPDQQRLQPEQWKEDLAFLARAIPQHHANAFHSISSAQFDDAVNRLDRAIPSLTDHQVIVEMMRLVALIGDGHTKLGGGLDFISGRLPLRFEVFGDGVYVIAAAPQYGDILGRRVSRIGTTDVEEVLTRLNEVTSGDNAMTKLSRLPDSLVLPDLLCALGLAPNKDRVTVDVQTENDHQSSFEIGSVPFDASISWEEVKTKERPLYLRHTKDRYWAEWIPAHSLLYVQFNQVRNKHGESIAAFFKRVVALATEKKVAKFVLDLRHNGGGNGYFNQPVIESLSKSKYLNRPGRLFVIVGRSTFSVAVKLVTQLDRKTRAIFVGEPTGGSPNHYGDAKVFSLPNSKLELRVSSISWEDAGASDSATTIRPEIEALLSFDDFARGRDPSLDAILKYGRN